MRQLFSMLLVPIAMETRPMWKVTASPRTREAAQKGIPDSQALPPKKTQDFLEESYTTLNQLSSDQNPGYLLYIYKHQASTPSSWIFRHPAIKVPEEFSLIHSTRKSRPQPVKSLCPQQWRGWWDESGQSEGHRSAYTSFIWNSGKLFDVCFQLHFPSLIFNPNIWKTLQHLGKFTFLHQFFSPILAHPWKLRRPKSPTNRGSLWFCLSCNGFMQQGCRRVFVFLRPFFQQKKPWKKSHTHTMWDDFAISLQETSKTTKLHCAKFHNPRVLRVRKKLKKTS